MITIDSLSLRYSSKVLFSEASANICAHDRVGLVGSNGSGKTTFLKILTGIEEPDEGKIEKANYVTIGYLPQDGIHAQGLSLFEEVKTAFEDILSIQQKIEDASKQLETEDPSSPQYADTLEVIGTLEHRLEEMEAHKLQSKIEKILLGLGFTMNDMQRDCGEFSGGWQMRIALAKLLLREPSLLLLDEPTNHLDLDSQRWLENYLKNYDGALMIISHDRTFLDILCNRTFELSLGNLNVYEGNYSYFEKESVQRKQLLQLAYKNQQKKIEQQERFIERFRAKATKARQVQSRIKALDKMEKIELEAEESRVHFSFPPAPQSGHIVLELKNAAKSYDSLNVFQNLDFKLERGDRFAVVGVNGAGKSTLAKVLAGIEPLSAGQRDVGLKVRLSYFAQNHAEALDPTKTVLETIEGASNVGERINLRTILGAFLFRGDDVFKSVSVLSGGEKCRLALACMVVQKANCLILDEPTNHLDMRSQEMLQHALSEYQGTLLIVSHNRGFLDPLVNKVLAVSKNGVEVFLGNVSEYLEHIEQTTLDQPTPKAQTAPKTENKLSQKERRKQRALEVEAQAKAKKRIDQLEKEIESLESIKKEMEEAMMDPQFFKQGDKTKEGLENYESLKRNLDRYLEEWSNLN